MKKYFVRVSKVYTRKILSKSESLAEDELFNKVNNNNDMKPTEVRVGSLKIEKDKPNSETLSQDSSVV